MMNIKIRPLNNVAAFLTTYSRYGRWSFHILVRSWAWKWGIKRKNNIINIGCGPLFLYNYNTNK